jgi:hypothetical protein
MTETITFYATLPDTTGAIKFAGNGGARVQLEIPETSEGDMVPLLLCRNRLLRVTIEPVDDGKS